MEVGVLYSASFFVCEDAILREVVVEAMQPRPMLMTKVLNQFQHLTEPIKQMKCIYFIIHQINISISSENITSSEVPLVFSFFSSLLLEIVVFSGLVILAFPSFSVVSVLVELGTTYGRA